MSAVFDDVVVLGCIAVWTRRTTLHGVKNQKNDIVNLTAVRTLNFICCFDPLFVSWFLNVLDDSKWWLRKEAIIAFLKVLFQYFHVRTKIIVEKS
jgi:hypothetical protein